MKILESCRSKDADSNWQILDTSAWITVTRVINCSKNDTCSKVSVCKKSQYSGMNCMYHQFGKLQKRLSLAWVVCCSREYSAFQLKRPYDDICIKKLVVLETLSHSPLTDVYSEKHLVLSACLLLK